MTAPPSLGIEGIDAAFQLLPGNQPVHPLQEQLPSGLALLPLIFQVGKEPALVKTGVGCSIPIHLSTGVACLPLLCHNQPDLFRGSLIPSEANGVANACSGRIGGWLLAKERVLPALPVNPGKGQPATCQTRIGAFDGIDRTVGDALLSAYPDLYGRIQRRLFAQVSAGRSAPGLKQEYLQRYRIPARMFNAVRVSLEGKLSSVKGVMELRRDELQRRIARAQRQIAGAFPGKGRDWLHQKRRRRGNLKAKLEKLESDIAAGRIRLCFGSRKLWRKQFAMEATGDSSHDEWLGDWRDFRSDEFFVLGSRDEKAGCQLCVATVAGDGSLALRLRLPDSLAEEQGKYLVIPGIRFKYGHEQVLGALQSNAEYASFRRKHGEKAARQSGLGQAVSYRFKRDWKGWRVFVTTCMAQAPVVTDRARGAIGVDLNTDYLAVSETDSSGNWVRS